MKKYILRDGKEVHFGDIIEASKKCKSGYHMITATLDEDTLKIFKEMGIIRELELKDRKKRRKLKVSTDNISKDVIDDIKKMQESVMLKQEELMEEMRKHHINKAYESIASKLGVKKEDAIVYVEDLASLNSSAAFSLMAKKIALQLNNEYKDSITDANCAYYISNIDGKIYSIFTKNVNIKNIALFRSVGDAQFAIECLYWLYNDMFNTKQNAKQKSN